ncbi:hypothetical protein UFOVP190_281 [uncultured Caudovirales phage]|uniref:Uncharacterized protein n=1 Tax=uncultured Caudovirales phage TaxID=2100421 RepID=A0A6J7WH04_9CAUD|nr:hypothetical protein UFOVP190_281 [uncultured Caudovirales phage]
MFSLDNFYNIIHSNLIGPIGGQSNYFTPFGTYQHHMVLDRTFQITDITEQFQIKNSWNVPNLTTGFHHCYFFDQEPFYTNTRDIALNSILTWEQFSGPEHVKILANSEHSELISKFAKDKGFYNWYYFFHGIAALDWYRDFQYVPQSYFNRYDKVFICYNHIISKLRSYRLHLVSNLIEQNLVQHGHVSLQLQDHVHTWQEVIKDPEAMLSGQARLHINRIMSTVTEPLVIDTVEPHGSLSAEVNLDQLTSALWHVVTETVYFLPKLHLTEKIFKPIVARRPFMLVGAPGNLAYLKSYGFKTFDQWIDESYDQEQDHYIRIEKITAEIARLCAMPADDLKQMHQDMQTVLEHNFQHFYGSFKSIIVNELVDNFQPLVPDRDLTDVKLRLLN